MIRWLKNLSSFHYVSKQKLHLKYLHFYFERPCNYPTYSKHKIDSINSYVFPDKFVFASSILHHETFAKFPLWKREIFPPPTSKPIHPSSAATVWVPKKNRPVLSSFHPRSHTKAQQQQQQRCYYQRKKARMIKRRITYGDDECRCGYVIPEIRRQWGDTHPPLSVFKAMRDRLDLACTSSQSVGELDDFIAAGLRVQFIKLDHSF